MDIGSEHELELVVPSPSTSIPTGKVLHAMELVVASKHFRTSKQCQNLLRYVVVHTLEGKEEDLKERIIGSEVFARPLDYNTADDPVVRTRAADVRKRLAVYYQDEGQHDSIRITMPSGSYRAFFEIWDHSSSSLPAGAGLHASDIGLEHRLETQEMSLPASSSYNMAVEFPLQPAISKSESADRPSQRPFGKVMRIAIVGCVPVLALMLAGLLTWQASRARTKQFETFWAPILTGSRPPIIYVGSSAVYRLTTSYIEHYQATHPDFRPDRTGREFTVPMSPNDQINSSDLVPDDRTFVTVGDVAAAVIITSMFAERRQPYDLRFGLDVVYGDFRTTPVVLVGAFNNSWTIELNDKLPFAFGANNSIRELQGRKRTWQTVRDDRGVPHEDYALISRQVSAKSGKLVITVAGLDQTGTRAAAEFVRDPVKLDAALQKLPSGWQNKNLQLVLHTNVLDYLPSGTEVIASAVQ
jgi:hypothetical protein